MPPLRLAPGLRVVPRGRDRLQVGLLDDRRVVLPRTARIERLLRHLAVGGATDADPALDPLLAAGLLEPHDGHAPAPVRVQGRVHGLDHATLLTSWGLRVVDDDTAPVLLLAAGELEREPLDPLVRHGVPHLVTRLLDGAALLGPFVEPGRTACLRCLDAHDADEDPELAAVTGRYALADPAPGDLPDPALATQALAWAARDLLGHARGCPPSTWSSTWRLGPDPGTVRHTPWTRHPLCGCTWSADAPLAGKLWV